MTVLRIKLGIISRLTLCGRINYISHLLQYTKLCQETFKFSSIFATIYRNILTRLLSENILLIKSFHRRNKIKLKLFNTHFKGATISNKLFTSPLHKQTFLMHTPINKWKVFCVKVFYFLLLYFIFLTLFCAGKTQL